MCIFVLAALKSFPPSVHGGFQTKKQTIILFIIVLVTYCCITIVPQTLRCKTTHVYDLRVSEGWDSRAQLSRVLCTGSHQAAVKVSTGLGSHQRV